jgi:hypothetical protein
LLTPFTSVTQRDPYWLAFFHLTHRNNAYLGPPLSHPSALEAGHAVSKLEFEYAQQRQRRSGGEVETEDDGERDGKEFDVFVGRLASQLVNEEEEEDFPALSSSTSKR